MSRGTSSLFVVFLVFLSSLVSAQFNIFDQFFGGQQQQHRQQHQQQSRGVEWLKQHYDAAACEQYLCPDSLACVGSAKDCPCPFGQDKCVLGKLGDYVCVSPVNGISGCDVVVQYRKGDAY